MKLYLDTNVLFALFLRNEDKICADVQVLLEDYSNTLYTSSVCVMELIHLQQTGDLIDRSKKHNKYHSEPTDLLDWLREIGVSVLAITEKHLHTMQRLPNVKGHSDPNDRLIIAQAITDKVALVSSDTKFPLYEPFGLHFIPNR